MEFHTALQHVRLGLLDAGKHAATLDDVAGAARGNQVTWYFLPFVCPGMEKINRHDQRILKIRHTVQPAILATIVVAFEDPVTFFRGQRLGQPGQAEKIWNRQGTPPRTVSYALIMLPTRRKEKPRSNATIKCERRAGDVYGTSTKAQENGEWYATLTAQNAPAAVERRRGTPVDLIGCSLYH